MKILLDENIPHDLRHLLPGHEVFTVAYMGWSGVENGNLLKVAGEHEFEVIITKDSGVEYEQHLAALPLAVLVMKTRTNKLDDMFPLLPLILTALTTIQPRSLVNIG